MHIQNLSFHLSNASNVIASDFREILTNFGKSFFDSAKDVSCMDRIKKVKKIPKKAISAFKMLVVNHRVYHEFVSIFYIFFVKKPKKKKIKLIS